MMKRFIAIFMVLATALPLAQAPIAQAATTTGPWTWTDLSAQLTVRTNRPIWATAYANGSWFYTDGQNLWDAGQVYRYDGSTQINITTDVRNAGISRVDDIVSDGQSVLFLQNVVRLDNQLTAVAYQNGQYLNVTSYVRNALMSDEGVSSISGRNGTWYIVTTKNRLFRWSGNGTNQTQIALPSGVVNQLETSPSALIYSINHGTSAAGRVTVAMVPAASGNWLLMTDPTNGPVRFYRYDGSTFTDITAYTALTNIDTVSKIVSNGTQAFLSTYGANRNPQTGVTVTDGTSAVTLSAPGNLGNALIAWNGTSWMALAGKDLYRFVGSFANNGGYAYLGSVTDYFDAISSDNNGRLLLGGAISTAGNSNPSDPLTAKLVMVTEGVSAPVVNDNTGVTGSDNAVTVGGTFGGDRVYTSPSGPQVRIQGNPSGFRVGNGKEFAYRVTASDPNGVDRTDIYVNDARIKTCYADVCEFRTTYWTNGPSARTVKFWTRSTDKTGYSTDTSGNPDYLTVDPNSSLSADGTAVTNSTNNGAITDGNGSSWTWVDPNTTTLNKDQSVTFNVGAQDADGLNQIDIYANGSVVRTCTFGGSTANQSCNVTVYANNYTPGTNVFVNAKMTDRNGNVSWSTGTTFARSTDNGTSNNNADGSVWTALDPNITTLNANQSVTFSATAQDGNGLRQIDLYANGSVVRTCTFGNVTGNQTCSVTVSANSYAQGTSIFLNARATDANGNQMWSNSTTLTRATDGNSNNNNTGTNGSVWSWLDPNTTTLNKDQSVTFNVGAWDNDGLRRIELLANGSVVRTCDFGNVTGNQTCSATINANSYAQGTSVFLNARATDANGNQTWSDSTTLTRTNDGTTGNTNIDNATSQWTWIDPNTTTLNKDQSVTFYVGAQDADGLQQADIYANGSVIRTCTFGNATGNQTCSTTINANSYAQGTSVFVNAKLTDRNGNATWTNSTTLTRATDGSTGTTPAAGNVSVWSWFEPSGDLAHDGTVQFRSGAWAEKGLSSVELWVNGTVKRTCTFNAATGNQSCDVTLNGTDYPVGTSIAANVKATDANGAVSWSDIQTVHVVNGATNGSSGNSGSTNTGGSITVSSNKTSTYRANDLITITATGTDTDGIGRTEIWVNARLAKVCLNTGSCTVTVGPFPNNLVVTYGASLFDVNGNVATSGYKQIFLSQ